MSSEMCDEDEEMGIAGEMASCGKGHRSSLVLQTFEGGAICLVCLSALLSDPRSPSHHVSYALSQVSAAFRSPSFLLGLRTVHPHFLVAPLVRALSSFDDEPLARQIIDLISDLCGDGGSGSVSLDFISRISDVLSSCSLAWSRRQVHMLHCLGLLLESHQSSNPTAHIRDKAALFSNLVIGLQLPSEEIRGEILFILYKLSVLEGTPWDNYNSNHGGVSLIETSQLLRLSLEVLLKTQHDEVRLNCIALLTVLAQKGLFENSCRSNLIRMSSQEADNLTETVEEILHIPLVNLFADAIKSSLLSSDTQVQISTLDLVFHSLSTNLISIGQIQTLIEENIADYVFEILRLSGNKDPLVISCLHVLDLLATAEDSFRQRLPIGFPTLLSVLHYIVEIPLHPVQRQAIKLVWICISNCPGIVSISQVEELVVTLKGFFSRHGRGELEIPPQTFILACLTFVEIIKSPSASQMQKLRPVIQEASKSAVASSVSLPHGSSKPYLLYSLYILKELYMHNHEESSTIDSENEELENGIIQICETYLLSWLERYMDEGEEEEVILGVLEIFHLILLGGSEIQAHNFAETLASSYWFTLSFGCLGVFPSDRMKSRIYLMLSSVVDRIFGPEFGESIILAYIYLPSDPSELIFLLGQDGSHDSTLMCCQRATVLILYVSSLYDERLADESQVLASLEQYILVNSHNLSCETTDTMLLTQIIFLYGLLRSAVGHRTSNNTEAEKVFFNLVVKMAWDLLGIRSHPRALKWIFQQEELIEPLSYQLLNFCRIHSQGKDKVSTYSRNIKTMDLQMLAELVVSGDNFVTSLLVSLLEDVIEAGREDDTISILTVIEAILGVCPDSSNQFSLNGISDALYYVCQPRFCSHMIFATCLLLVFNILYLTNSTALSKEGKWPAITMKLLEFLHPKLASNTSGSEEHLVISILCLILQHASSDVLKESSKAIVLCTSLISGVDVVVKTACARGPALADYNEETAAGESLVFVLLLFFYTIRSSHALLYESIDWQDFLQTSGGVQPKMMRIQCNDLCRLVHFGSALVKVVASQCLMEVLSRISDQTASKNERLKCSARYLESMMAVTEGLVFYDDSTVAANCGICLSIILGWENLEMQDKRMIKSTKWCRLAMEELSLTLAAPRLALKSFTNQHKAAARVAVALLRLEQVPEWMPSIFSSSCVSGIISNLSASNVSPEIVMMFRALMSRKYLAECQIASLRNLLQVSRKLVYMDGNKQQCEEIHIQKVTSIPDDVCKLRSILIHLMLFHKTGSSEIQSKHKRLLEEIELFSLESSRQ